MFQTNTGWTQNCATLVNLIYAFVKYIFIFLATVNKSNIFECILHIFINSSWIKHSFKKILSSVWLPLHYGFCCPAAHRKGHKWVWFQVRWSSENIKFIRSLSVLGKGALLLPAGWISAHAERYSCSTPQVLCPYPQTNCLDYTMCIWNNGATQELECLLF